jgi:pyrimidine-nucleoside phosphorylase
MPGGIRSRKVISTSKIRVGMATRASPSYTYTSSVGERSRRSNAVPLALPEVAMRAVDIIRKKRDGLPLSPEEIAAFVAGATSGSWPHYQVSALLMAIVLRGKNPAETAELTRAMIASGEKLDWSGLGGVAVDKHSTGGVGDKTSLILAPLAAACGVLVPMMSGRGLGHSGGTLDKLESIPGFRVGLGTDEMRRLMEKVGCVMISPTDRIAPADRALYHLRDVTGTVESIPLISASIMSKKIAEGIQGLVMDVKCGSGAFMKTRQEARALAESLIGIGEAHGVRTEALLTAMDVPLGRMVGNALEVKESIEVLKGGGPRELRDLSLELAARMVRLGGAAANLDEARAKVRRALESGRGLEKLRQIVEAQGGEARVVDDHGLLPSVPHRHVVRAPRSGYVRGWEAEAVGRASVALGAGRDRAEDAVDPAVGAVVLARPGDEVREGDAILELHYRDPQKLARALELLTGACPIDDEPPPAQPLVLEELS